MCKLKYLKMIWIIFITFMAFATAQERAATEHYLVGSDSNYPPFQMRDGTGKIIGFEPDLLQRIGEIEGFTIEVVYYPRREWQKALDTGEVDIFASALGISPKRTAVAEMTQPTLDFYDAVYVLDNNNNANLQKMSDFLNRKFMGVSSSKSTSEFVKSLNDGSNSIDIKDSIFLALREVWAKKADAVTNNNRLFQYYGKKYPQFKYRLIPIEPANVRTFGFAVKKGRFDLRDKLNHGLERVKQDGSFQTIFEKWFGVELKDNKTEK